MNSTNTTDIFYKQLQELWSAENMLVEAMPVMIEKAHLLGLKKSLAHHLAETDKHKVAIEAICKLLGINPQGEENKDLKMILEEGEKAIAVETNIDASDKAIIRGAEKIEQYEIAAYEPVAEAAQALGYEGIAKRLRLTLEEERQAETKMKFMDKSFIQKTSVLGPLA